MRPPGDGARLLAISDLHAAHSDNRGIIESLRPSTDDDWLLVAGDVGEISTDIEWALALLAGRFAKVVWVPGNHELWTHPSDPLTLRGRFRYDHLVSMCRGLGISTPEDPYPVWTGEGGPVTIAPLFVLYDYTFRAPGTSTKEESLRVAHEAGVVCTDEYMLHPDPYETRDAWCAARVEETGKRLAACDPDLPTLLVSHWPLRREPTDVMYYPEFAQWCGTTATADWHVTHRALASVYGHLHIPRTTRYDGVPFVEVSVGYPREWRGRTGPRPGLREILPALARGGAMIEQVLPAAVTAYETFADAPGDVLFPEERAVVARAVDKRRREFTTVRGLARTAMADLGVAPAPLLPDRRGAPRWPDGLVGSMTHCDGYRAVAVARAADVYAVGIDAEPNEPLPEGVLDVVTQEAERSRIAGLLAGHPGVSWDRLVFSIKETVFKAWYPRTRYELDFMEADVTPAPGGETSGTFGFALNLVADGPDTRWLSGVRGHWTTGDGVLVTALAVPRTTLPAQRRG